MKYVYRPNGVCSQEMIFDIEDGIVKDLKVVGGCNGNLKGIGALIKDMKVEDIIPKLSGIKCGLKNTSCPDQISKALEKYLERYK
jgi:uncharacterized protein (TIGR03905 family)